MARCSPVRQLLGKGPVRVLYVLPEISARPAGRIVDSRLVDRLASAPSPKTSSVVAQLACCQSLSSGLPACRSVATMDGRPWPSHSLLPGGPTRLCVGLYRIIFRDGLFLFAKMGVIYFVVGSSTPCILGHPIMSTVWYCVVVGCGKPRQVHRRLRTLGSRDCGYILAMTVSHVY